jgi:5-formyltetrahydrofolate cyclo-ligase
MIVAHDLGGRLTFSNSAVTNRAGRLQDVVSEKAAVRATALAERRSRPGRDGLDEALAQGACDLVRGHETVAAYVPMPGEPGGQMLPARLAEAARAVLLPVLLPDLDLSWAVFDGALTAPGPAGVREPVVGDGDLLAISHATIVLVPALRVDHHGVRLGRGGGSYDRALPRAAPNAMIVALLYPGEYVESVPAESHDARVTHVLLPDGLITV